jgi:DNA-binding transcriptional LysR family regulator
MTVGLRHLQFVVVVAKHGSLRRAAKSLNIRQSTLSRAIRQLEIRLGLTVFIRSNTGVRLTLPGCQFLKAASRLVADFDALVSMAAAMGGGKAGRLRPFDPRWSTHWALSSWPQRS